MCFACILCLCVSLRVLLGLLGLFGGQLPYKGLEQHAMQVQNSTWKFPIRNSWKHGPPPPALVAPGGGCTSYPSSKTPQQKNKLVRLVLFRAHSVIIAPSEQSSQTPKCSIPFPTGGRWIEHQLCHEVPALVL